MFAATLLLSLGAQAAQARFTLPQLQTRAVVPVETLDACPGYNLTNVELTDSGLTADLVLAGKACNVFGKDLTQLKLEVDYETENRLHLKITDSTTERYEIPESVFPRPTSNHIAANASNLSFNYTTSPFSFTISRTTANSTTPLFDTSDHPLIFESQYIRLKTSLPENPNIYGLGEHTDNFRLPTENYTRTLWTRDAYGVPNGTNLYSSHPVYFDHRLGEGTHAAFLLNSNGMDVKIDNSTLEYNVVGGVLDFYFLAGGQDPIEVTKQYAEVVGTPAEVPYWGFGFHQCRFGYKDFVDVSEVITNYSQAGIPLETMWTDIDYMDRRRVFTVDPDYFPMSRMREIIDYLHEHDQQFMLMTDPAVAYLPNDTDNAYARGKALDIWLKRQNGSDFLGLVWPGVTVYPDWFDPKVEDFWTNEFKLFYDPATGIDADGMWIDMNEPASFCNFPCEDPFQQAIEQSLPPPRAFPPPAPDTPIFGRDAPQTNLTKRVEEGDDLLFPPYEIENAAGGLSNKTAHTDVVHANGLVEYDTHNLYGTLMSSYTQRAMAARRPGRRTLIITRSTFAGAGTSVGKWLGDNLSTWWHYRNSIAGMLGMASIFQVPMVGSDVCGFGANTTENLCARWATLGAFNPFMRNHNGDTSISQEFYRWPVVAEAAKNAIDIRYRLLDYIYTAFHHAHTDGTPILNPLWYKYPSDPNTFPIDLQFLYGPSILVSPVTEENSTSVTFYLPEDTFYDFVTLEKVEGAGANVTLEDVNATQIPLHIKGGSIVPLRVEGAMTTKALRQKGFELVVAIGKDGKASGELYVDDGESVDVGGNSTWVTFEYEAGSLSANGTFGYADAGNIARVRFLGASEPKEVTADSQSVEKDSWAYDAEKEVLDVTVAFDLSKGFEVKLS